MHNHLVGTAGAIGASVDDIVISMKIMNDPNIHRLDPFASPTPWNEEYFQSVQAMRNMSTTKIGIL